MTGGEGGDVLAQAVSSAASGSGINLYSLCTFRRFMFNPSKFFDTSLLDRARFGLGRSRRVGVALALLGDLGLQLGDLAVCHGASGHPAASSASHDGDHGADDGDGGHGDHVGSLVSAFWATLPAP